MSLNVKDFKNLSHLNYPKSCNFSRFTLQNNSVTQPFNSNYS